MAKVLMITQARLQSKRFPKKILQEIKGESLLQIHLKRLKKSNYSNNLIVATTNEKGIDTVLDILKALKVNFFQGDELDVLDRFYKAAIEFKPSFVVRVTSDCPLIDSKLIDQIVDFAIKEDLDYISNTLLEMYPDGQDVEVIKWSALKMAWKDSKSSHEREHVTTYIRENSTFFGGKIFKSKNFNCFDNYNNIRMTVDQIEDFDAIKLLIEKLGTDQDWLKYTNFISRNRNLFYNQSIIRNEGSII